jgi:taurine transport system substrate-binding protein
LAAIDQAGIDPAKVTIIDLQPQDILAAWIRGDIDGAYVWHPTLAAILEDGHVITDSEELAGKGALTADLGVVRREFARAYPDIVTAYLKIQRRAIELYRSKPSEAAAAIAKQLGITEKEALEQTRQLLWLLPSEQTAADYLYLGTSDTKGKLADTLKSTADFLVKQGSIEKAASLDDFKAALNPKFAEEASK